MTDYNWCHGPKCHKSHTQDRIRGVKGSKVLRTRKIAQNKWNANNYFSHFCSQGCYTDFFKEHIDTNYKGVIKNKEWNDIEDAILSLEVMPSMRALMTAGDALDREHVAGYNCSYIPIDSPRAFDEVLYILMNGTGVGFSVERQYSDKLPTVPDVEFEHTEDDRLIAEFNDDGQIVTSSVYYECEECGGHWVNADKDYFLANGEWRATATPRRPGMRSYHLPGLLSPVGVRSWEAAVL